MRVANIRTQSLALPFLFIFLIIAQPVISNTTIKPQQGRNKYINHIKNNYLGEIRKHSYIKLSIESADENLETDVVIIPVKGSYLEARTSKVYHILGHYNTETFIWKLDCFDDKQMYTSTFFGKEDADGNIEGTWTQQKKSYSFYLKKNIK